MLGIDVYASVSEKVSDMRHAGIPVKGTLRELLSQVDVVADCTPKRIGAANKPLYEEVGVARAGGACGNRIPCAVLMSEPCSFGLSEWHAVPSIEVKNVYLLQEMQCAIAKQAEAEHDRGT